MIFDSSIMMPYFAFGTPGLGEIAIMGLLVLAMFGGTAFTDMAKALGKGMKEFKRAMNDIKNSDGD